MKKIFNKKNSLSVFDLWRKTQIKVGFIHKQILLSKKKDATNLLEKYELIFSKLGINANNNIIFEKTVFVALIKYLMDSNEFFDKRLVDGEIDELLLLAYIYEWIVLDKPKDISLLGNRSQVLKKFREASNQSNSYFQKIFEGIDIYSLDDWQEIVKRINDTTILTFNEIIEFIRNDSFVYKKVIDESFNEKDFNDKKQCIENWNKLFLVSSNNLNYVYSIEDSDSSIIYVSVETAKEKVAFVKYKMFYTYTKENNSLIASGISKELLRIDFIRDEYSNRYGDIISNSLKIANRAIKNIFLLDLQLKNDEGNINFDRVVKHKKIVNIIKSAPKKDSSVIVDNKRKWVLN